VTVFFRTIAGATLAVALAAAIELFLILLLPCVAAPALAAAAGEMLLILLTSLGIAWLAANAALQARRDGNVWQSAARDWTMNADQVETCRDYAADYRRIARDHVADARLAKTTRLVSRYHGRIAA
jgi:hypothetical protein